MKNILNAILVGVILYVGNLLFPEYIYVAGIKALVIAVLVFMAADIAFGLVVSAVMFFGAMLGAGTAILSFGAVFVAAFAWTPVKLIILNDYVPGISFYGILTYVLLTVALSLFNLKSKSKN